MLILFNIHYVTSYADGLFVNIKMPGGRVETHKMTQWQDGCWQCELRLEPQGTTVLDYYYSVQRMETVHRTEWTTQAHRIDLGQTGLRQYTVYDTWIDIPHDTYLYTSAYTQCINRREKRGVYRKTTPSTLRLKVRAPQLRGFERLVLSGSHPVAGEWDLERAIPCVEQAPNEWVCDIGAEYAAGEELEYKFVAVKENDVHDSPMWETGENRRITIPRMRQGEIVEHELSQAFFEIWNVRKAGTLVPVFSLRTEGSFGVGDFGDLMTMVDWVAYTGQRLLQVLPINDTTITHTWTDSYPYSCISIFALHPQYVDFRQLPPLADKRKAEEMEALRRELNALPQIDYERVNNAKNEYLRLLYAQEGKEVTASQDYKSWFAEEQQWLVPYAMYCYLRDTTGTADFTRWKGNETWNEADRASLVNPRTKAYRQVAFYYYVQYVLASQMKAAHGHAREKRVILKGDIPIGVHRQGCDVWQEARYFNLDGQAGAPPDEFSINGQNWGFPTYNWDEMLKDGCLWWVRRFRNMQKYFDAYRIDHVLGFFRIWEIPSDAVHGLMGQFQPALGLTPEEIEAYGLHFRRGRFTRPYITKEILEEIFGGEQATLVRDRFLDPYKDGLYLPKAEYDTQRKVEAKVSDANLRDGLYTLLSDVLFIRDRKNPELYHPRIAAQHTYLYKTLLSESDRNCFNRLYDDYYYHRNTLFWYKEAMKKLPKLVEATRMLVCAEDLGMIPECVPTVMNELRILSLEVQSMPKETGRQFGRPESYPYRSVCTIDSHDMPTLRMWWDEDFGRSQDFYSSVLGRRDDAPHPLPSWLARDIMSRNLQSASMLCVLSLQDWLAISDELRLPDAAAERINIPANPRHYWRYRMHLNISDMMKNQRFCDDIAEMITQSGR
ncbi:MAG: 4-alpha-glucanotransferase [Prevotella sp.]|nr:4-alpha-glucanotransferase [Prevotella sp.]